MSKDTVYMVIFKGISIDILFAREIDYSSMPAFIKISKIISSPPQLSGYPIPVALKVDDRTFFRYSGTTSLMISPFHIVQIELFNKTPKLDNLVKIKEGI